MLLSFDMKNQLAIVYTQNRVYSTLQYSSVLFRPPHSLLATNSCFLQRPTLFLANGIKQDFGTVKLLWQGERKQGRGIRETEERVIKRVSGGRRKGGRGADRSDRVAYGVVAGSRKEQQIQWLYRPSPV